MGRFLLSQGSIAPLDPGQKRSAEQSTTASLLFAILPPKCLANIVLPTRRRPYNKTICAAVGWVRCNNEFRKASSRTRSTNMVYHHFILAPHRLLYFQSAQLSTRANTASGIGLIDLSWPKTPSAHDLTPAASRLQSSASLQLFARGSTACPVSSPFAKRSSGWSQFSNRSSCSSLNRSTRPWCSLPPPTYPAARPNSSPRMPCSDNN